MFTYSDIVLLCSTTLKGKEFERIKGITALHIYQIYDNIKSAFYKHPIARKLP